MTLTKVSLDVISHKVLCNATFGQETAPELTGMLSPTQSGLRSHGQSQVQSWYWIVMSSSNLAPAPGAPGPRLSDSATMALTQGNPLW